MHMEEKATPTAAAADIDTVAISPADADPTVPAMRNMSSSARTLDIGWYQVVFYDAAGHHSEPFGLVRDSSVDSPLPPTPDQVREASPLLRQRYPEPQTDPFQTSDLRNAVYQATALVQANVWRLIDPTLGCSAPEDYTCEVVTDALVPIAVRAVTIMTERLVVTEDPAYATQFALGRHLRGFSAGPYSESYFAPGEFARRGAQQGRPPMDSDDALDALLWALATEDARDYFVFRATGVSPPIGSATAFDYRRQSVGYSAGSLGGWPGRGGPDGF